MPYAIVIHAFPKTDLPLAHAQGKLLHGLLYEIRRCCTNSQLFARLLRQFP